MRVPSRLPNRIDENTTASVASAPRKRPNTYAYFGIGALKKKWCISYSKSCCTERPIIAATTVTPRQPTKATVMAIWRGALISTRPPNDTKASLNTPPAAAIHSMVSAKKARKYTQVDSSLRRCRASKPAMARSAPMGQQFPAWSLWRPAMVAKYTSSRVGWIGSKSSPG